MGVKALIWPLAALIVIAIAPTPAAGQPSPDPCRTSGDQTGCYVARERAWLDLYGLVPAERLRAEGAEIRRAMFVDGYGGDVVAIEFARLPGQEPTVSIYLPRQRGTGSAQPALMIAIPQADWEATGAQSRHFDRALAPQTPPTSADGEISVCTHAWFYVVEVTDPASDVERDRLRRRAEDACQDGLTADYATWLSDLAVGLLPACAALDRSLHRNSATILATCARFSGDRLAAAMVYDRLGQLRGGGHSSQLPLLQSLFSGATLDWNGERISARVPEAWLARTSGESPAGFFVHRIYGERARRVRVEAFLERWIDQSEGPAQLWRAPVEMVWEYTSSRIFQMKQAIVRDFVRTQSRCNPNRLTSADNC